MDIPAGKSPTAAGNFQGQGLRNPIHLSLTTLRCCYNVTKLTRGGDRDVRIQITTNPRKGRKAGSCGPRAQRDTSNRCSWLPIAQILGLQVLFPNKVLYLHMRVALRHTAVVSLHGIRGWQLR